MADAGAYLSPPQLARRWAIKHDRVLAYIRSGDLAAVDMRSPGATRPRWRISPEAVAAFETRRQSRPPTPKQHRSRRQPAKRFTYV